MARGDSARLGSAVAARCQGEGSAVQAASHRGQRLVLWEGRDEPGADTIFTWLSCIGPKEI